MRDSTRVLSLTLVLTAGLWSAAAAKTTKESVTSGGVSRPYYLAVPDKLPSSPMPLIVLLHGSGRDGKSLLTYWEKLADKEGIVVVGAEAEKGARVPACQVRGDGRSSMGRGFILTRCHLTQRDDES